LSEIDPSNYPLPLLGLSIQRWMRELDDGRGFILIRGFPVADYFEEDAAIAYWLIGLHMGTRSFATGLSTTSPLQDTLSRTHRGKAGGEIP
jgi:hypothetical protein